MSLSRRLRVLIVDDSALIRKVMEEILSHAPDLEVVGAAADPYIAWDKIRQLRPDVVTLDVEMPRMDGLTFLEKLMRAHPLPVVMVSSLTERSCDITLRALEMGAMDFVTKPKVDIARGTADLGAEIVEKVRAAGNSKLGLRTARVSPTGLPSAAARAERQSQEPGSPPPRRALITGTYKIVAIGASTGGTEALRELLCELPPDAPGIVIVQHMPERFTRAFADRLNGLARIRISEAVDGDRVLPGHALIAPGNFHMELVRSGADYRVRVFTGEPVNRHRPSVDTLFHSCARAAGQNAVGAILTGMGDDGARGLLAMRTAGAHTIAQNEATCVVFGMPREAIALGGAEFIEPLPNIARRILLESGERRTATP